MKSRLHAHVGTLRQLEILLAVHTAGSVKGAAESLHLTQPTISMQLKKLADAIDMPLYDLVGRKIVFTEAGMELVAASRQILDDFARLEMNLANLRGLKAGTLKLAVVTTSKYFIPHLLGPFCERYPEVDVRLKVGNRQQIIERLRSGDDDFCVFSHPPQDIELECIEFLGNPLVAIAPADHPLGKRRQIAWKDIADEPFLMREPGSGTRFAIEEFMRANHYTLNSRMTIESNEAIKHAVMSGLGISILSAHTLVYGGQSGLSRLNVRELPIVSRWYFTWLKAKPPSLIAGEFLSYLQNEGRRMLLAELKRNGIRSKFLQPL